MTHFQKTNVPILVCGDLVNLSLAFFISLYYIEVNDAFFQEMQLFILPTLVFLWLIIGNYNKLYSNWENGQFLKLRIGNYLKTYLFLAGFVGLVFLIFSFPEDVRNLLLAILLGIPTLGIFTNLLLIRVFKMNQDRKGRVNTILVAGFGNQAKKAESFLASNPFTRYSLQGFIDCNLEESEGRKSDRIVTDLDNLTHYLNDHYVDEIILALPFHEVKSIKSIVKIADYHGARVRFIPDYQDVFGERFKTFQFGNLEVVNTRQLPLDNSFLSLLKNFFDIVFSICILIMLSPIFLIIGILVKLDAPGPVLYLPERIGKNSKPFRLYKFRTMNCCDDPKYGIKSTTVNDPRITPVGKFLRKYSLDELPQFINVLVGNMSVVGPRPHRIHLNQMMQASEEKYMIRHYYKPGITGWAQVNGWRGPLETPEQKKQRTNHDLWYLENWSFWLDLKIIFLTVFGSKTHKSSF
ncbi:MAG: undecaprenyl-phosphate glucose phosphotransferase [Cyclobacteriaceae bacterium]